ncbi:MAG TPA: hypothetical protein PKW38_06260, partial [Paludibacteraceae bacterium]|nr:hypothetical protein [Paludibacteraceae bacterium]
VTSKFTFFDVDKDQVTRLKTAFATSKFSRSIELNEVKGDRSSRSSSSSPSRRRQAPANQSSSSASRSQSSGRGRDRNKETDKNKKSDRYSKRKTW